MSQGIAQSGIPDMHGPLVKFLVFILCALVKICFEQHNIKKKKLWHTFPYSLSTFSYILNFKHTFSYFFKLTE